MAGNPLSLPAEYWGSLRITRQDIEYLHNYLFESETPMTARELAAALIEERIRAERAAQTRKKQADGKTYLPGGRYRAGERLTFPALGWQKGKVIDVRPGMNPAIGVFEVLTVDMEDGGQRLFAAGLARHSLNDQPAAETRGPDLDPQVILSITGAELEKKLEDAFRADEGLVRIAGRWFPRALLVDVNTGHLNLAEAVLDMAGGEPLPTAALLKDVELPEGVNPKLTEFSLNLALQEDGRFDEVGPAGQVLWCLRRLEPEGVREMPFHLRYVPIEHERAVLTEELLAFEAQQDDELAEAGPGSEPGAEEVVISLIYPHWRAGTLPITARVRSLFPTAYESPRVRFTLVDGNSGVKMPAWVVRKEGYVYGLSDWYRALGLMPGSLVHIRRGDRPGEVMVSAKTCRATRDWVRTVIVGADGGVVFALLKQPITAEFNERMALAVPDPQAVDELWLRAVKNRQTFESLLVNAMRELSKLTPQGHVHAQELYSAVNVLRRCPPAPLLSLLVGKPWFMHVGDLHFRLDEAARQEAR